MKLIFDEIRELKKSIDELQMKIDCFTTVGAIRYDKECVQTSPSGDSLEKSVIRLIEDQENLEHLKREWTEMCANVNLDLYTVKQREFIELYYFQAYSMKKCCSVMHTKYNNLYNLKKRILC